MSWSYDLLKVNERLLFDRLSVFSGEISLADVENVCAAAPLGSSDVDDLLGTLVDKSMISVQDGKYAMLQTLRQFGNGNLAERGEVEQLRRLHLDHFQSVAAAASQGIQGADEASWDERLDGAAANLQSAFAWACESGDADAALHMVAHLTDWAFWRTRPELGEWRRLPLRLPGAPQHSPFSTVHGSAAARRAVAR